MENIDPFKNSRMQITLLSLNVVVDVVPEIGQVGRHGCCLL